MTHDVVFIVVNFIVLGAFHLHMARGRTSPPEHPGIALGTWHLALSTWQLRLDSWHLALGTWHLALAIQHLASGTWHLAPAGACHLTIPKLGVLTSCLGDPGAFWTVGIHLVGSPGSLVIPPNWLLRLVRSSTSLASSASLVLRLVGSTCWSTSLASSTSLALPLCSQHAVMSVCAVV